METQRRGHGEQTLISLQAVIISFLGDILATDEVVFFSFLLAYEMYLFVQKRFSIYMYLHCTYIS